jgi:hypothetical protein
MMSSLQRVGITAVTFLAGWVCHGWLGMSDTAPRMAGARSDFTATAAPSLALASNASPVQAQRVACQPHAIVSASPKPQTTREVAAQSAQDEWLVIGTRFLATTDADLKERLHRWIDEAPTASRYEVALQALNAPSAGDRKSAYLWLTNLSAAQAEPARQARLAAMQTETDVEALRTLVGALATETDELTQQQRSAVVRRLQELAQIAPTELAADSVSHLIRLDTSPATVSVVAAGLQDTNTAQQLRTLKALSQTSRLEPALDAVVRTIAEDGSRPREIRSLANQLLKGNHCS